jgi:hypothetical protein
MAGACMFRLAAKRGHIFLLGSIIILSACDNSDGGGGGGVEADNTRPRLSVFFPPRYSITDGDTVVFHGRADDDESGMDYVRVNGEDVTTDDDFSSWQITLPLEPGTNNIEVVARDEEGNRRSTTVTIRREVPLLSPQRLAIDGDNNRILVTDDLLQSVIAIDTATGTRSIFSGPELANPFAHPFEIAIDSERDRALVLDPINQHLYAVDLATGARTLFSEDVISFGFDKDLIIDGFAERALVLDSDTVKAVDLETGVATVLSDATTPDTDNVISGAFSMAQDGGGRILVMEGDRVIAVNSLGFRTVLSDTSFYPYYHAVSDCAFDIDTNQLLSVDASLGNLLGENVAPIPDPRSILVENLPVSGFGAVGIAVDSLNARVLATDSEAATILAIDPNTQQSSVLWHNSTPDTNNTFAFPAGIVVDSARNRALVNDTSMGIVAVDLVTGARTAFSDFTTPNDVNPIFQPTGIALDTPDNRLLVVDRAQDLVMAVNLATGVRTIFSDSSTGDNPFNDPQQIVIDRANNRALVTDSGLDAIVAVNLDTGARTILSNNDSPGIAAANFGDPLGIAVDAANNRALVVETPPGAATIIAVNLDTGARSVFSNSAVPNTNAPLLSIPWSIYIDTANNRALVGDVGRSAILALSLTDGARSFFSSNTDTSNKFYSPMGIAMDQSRRRLLVLDGTADSVLAVQPDTGARVVFSK